MEIKDIKGFEGKYGVSNDGKVWSWCKPGSRTQERLDTPVEKKPHLDSKGNYLMATLSENNKSINKSIHRLVAEAFIPNPDNLPEVDHIDNNMTNNDYSNLQWVDRKTNMDKMYSNSSPVRNYKICELFHHEVSQGYFISINAACKYASDRGGSYSSLNKNHVAKRTGWRLEKCIDYPPEGSTIRDENGLEVVPEFGLK